ncbi:hypothetical protein N7G274_006373 [Stereocaulon virgatum]|uniref:Uncharacterized protein n=1 Tax=Stereocaulon virgatum TaxID=373712 RepID=A0ABR4A640_9LECA
MSCPDENPAISYELDQIHRSTSQPANSASAARSRASSLVSSVFSTGTRFSITTLPQGTYHIDSVLEENPNESASGIGGGGAGTVGGGSEGSIDGYSDSIRSTSTSLPPYEIEVGGYQGESSTMLGHGCSSHDIGGSAPPSPAAEQAPTTPTAMVDPENLISRHYGAVVRTIDANHQRLLARTIQAHEREMAEMRDGIDRVYRREFREREREVERVREGAAAERRALEEGKEREREEWGKRVEVLKEEIRDLRREKEEEERRGGQMIRGMEGRGGGGMGEGEGGVGLGSWGGSFLRFWRVLGGLWGWLIE